MNNLHAPYVHESYDESGILSEFSLTYPDSFNFGYDVVDRLAEIDPTRRAMVWSNPEGEEHTFTFADMKYWSDKTANYLQSLGVTKGDAVMVILKRHYQFWFIAVALHKLGAVIVPATFMLKEHDLEYRLTSSSTKVVICTSAGDIADTCDKVIPLCPTVTTKIIVNGGAAGLIGELDVENGVSLSGPEGLCTLAATRDGWDDFNAGVRAASSDFSPVETSVIDPSLMYFSSGTTGNPKMVLHNGTYPLAHIPTAKHWHNVVSDGGIHFTVADTGWGKAVWGKLYGQWLMEACVYTYDLDRFVPADILALIEKHGITTMCVPPTMYRMMMAVGLDSYDLSKLSYCTTAGEALNPDLFEGWFAATGLKLVEGFGQTETVVAICNTVGMECKPGSMGKPSPLFSIELHDDEGKRCTTGQTGEVVIKSDPHPEGLMVEYYRDAAKTAEAMHNGFYHTGDLAWFDEDGYYWYVGRNDDVIKSSGYRIGPFEVESVLLEHAAVKECAITGVPDEVRGFAVKATIVLNDGFVGDEALTKELQKWVKTNTAPYKYPRIIDYIDALPKTVNGKIRRAEIRNADA